MKRSVIAAIFSLSSRTALGFAPSALPLTRTESTSSTSSTSLYALGVLARKAKEADVRKYCEGGIDDSVMEQVKIMKENLANLSDEEGEVGPVQTNLTKRKGTISIVAEYKRKF